MHVQVIDDLAGHTLAAASSMEADVRALEGDKKAEASKVGALVAARAKEAGIEAVVFDRAGYKYHGRVAALADAAREGGDRKSTRLNSSHVAISYAVFCLKKKKKT